MHVPIFLISNLRPSIARQARSWSGRLSESANIVSANTEVGFRALEDFPGLSVSKEKKLLTHQKWKIMTLFGNRFGS